MKTNLLLYRLIPKLYCDEINMIGQDSEEMFEQSAEKYKYQISTNTVLTRRKSKVLYMTLTTVI